MYDCVVSVAQNALTFYRHFRRLISDAAFTIFFRRNKKKLLAENTKQQNRTIKAVKIIQNLTKFNTRMWPNAQPDGRPAEHRWRPLFNAAKFG